MLATGEAEATRTALVAVRPMCGAADPRPIRVIEEESGGEVRPRMREAWAQARFAAELAAIHVDCGRWFVVAQPANPTMRKRKAMRCAAGDTLTVVVSVRSEVGDEEMRFATNAPQVAKRISECGRAEDANVAICDRLRGQLPGSVNIDYVYQGDYFEERSDQKLDGAEVDKAKRE